MVRAAVSRREQACWWNEVTRFTKLRTYVICKQPERKLHLESYLTVPHGGWNDQRLIGRRVLTRLRCGTNELSIETGRHSGLAIADRVCPICRAQVEDERHFLLECEHYQQQRAALWVQIDQLVQAGGQVGAPAAAGAAVLGRFSSSQLPPAEQLTLLVGGYHPAIVGESLRLRVMSAILIALGQWALMRAEYLDLYERASAHSSV